MFIGDRIREEREKQGITQSVISERFKISNKIWSSYEKNRKTPDVEMVKKIAEYFDVTSDYLLGINLEYQDDMMFIQKRLLKIKNKEKFKNYIAKYEE
ncbi:MAG: helix-turn-helix domain-containing protein [Sarcina sp.]